MKIVGGHGEMKRGQTKGGVDLSTSSPHSSLMVLPGFSQTVGKPKQKTYTAGQPDAEPAALHRGPQNTFSARRKEGRWMICRNLRQRKWASEAA